MSRSSGPSEWSVLHDVALLYLALAHGTDLEIDPSEQATMVEKLKAWYPEAGAWRVRHSFRTRQASSGPPAQHVYWPIANRARRILDFGIWDLGWV